MLDKTIGGRYQIVHHLGGGGFGQTYLAEDLHLPGKPTCVVKHLKPRMTDADTLPIARRLFDTEAQVLYKLGEHDQIPRLFAHFEEQSDFYLVQEFIEGEVLSSELKSRQKLTETEVIQLLMDILTVLEFVHQQQVIHRDIKPSNLIRRGSDRRIVLIDFGAVKQIGIQVSETSHLATVTIAVGSSGYMPNEQLAGKPRFSSDIYAVGILGIQCLTGISPGKLPEDPRTSEIQWRDRACVSPGIADFLDRMVRYDFRQRHPTAGDALAALKSLTEVSSVTTLLTQPQQISLDGHLVWLDRGDDLFQNQRYREAVLAYDRVLQAKPEDYQAWFKRGMALEHLALYEEAAACYEQLVRLQPQDYLAWYKWGVTLGQLQRYPESLQAFEQVVQLQPDHYWAWHDRGKVLEQLQDTDRAIASYERAVQLKPDFQLAIESRRQVLSNLRRVDELYHLQHYDEAVAACDRLLQEDESNGLAWLMRGMALENLHRYQDAADAYAQVVQLQPDDHVAWFKQAGVLEKLGQEEGAITAYARVVQIQPQNYWAWYDQGRLLEHQQSLETAIACYDRAVQLKSDLQVAVDGRKRILEKFRDGMISVMEPEEDETIHTSMVSGVTEKMSGTRNRSNAEASDSEALVQQYKRLLEVFESGTEPDRAGNEIETTEITTCATPPLTVVEPVTLVRSPLRMPDYPAT